MQLEIRFGVDNDQFQTEGAVDWEAVARYVKSVGVCLYPQPDRVKLPNILKDANGNTIGEIRLTETTLERLRRKGVSIS